MLIRISDETHKKLKVMAYSQGSMISKVAEKIIAEWVEKQTEGKKEKSVI